MTKLETMGVLAKKAERALRTSDEKARTEALLAIACALTERTDEILAANEKDLSAAEGILSPSMIDRLRLSKERVRTMADAVKAVAAWPDPSGKVLESRQLPNGILLEKRTVPLGVVGIIFESRPNVTSDCAALCIRAGNACILRGGKEARHSNRCITEIMRDALADSTLDVNCIQLVTDTSRRSAEEMMTLTSYLDVLIPRGGKGLIRSVVENAKVPVIETGAGNCHIYVDRAADPAMALDIIFNAKTSRPSVCNAAEKVLVHREVAPSFLPAMASRLSEKKVEFHADESALGILGDAPCPVLPAEESDWDCEYLDFILGVKIMDSLDEAIDHIEAHSTRHSECIVTEDPNAAEKFLTAVDAAAVYHNASTRFTDGGELGLGAEIGISTQKLHARGPMGVDQLVSSKYVLRGNGQTRN